MDLSVDRIVDGEHEKPLVGAAAQAHNGAGDACRCFAGVVEGVARRAQRSVSAMARLAGSSTLKSQAMPD